MSFHFSLPRLVAMSALLLGVGLAQQAHADTFIVTNLDDSGAGSLRAAVEDANSNSNPDIEDLIAFASGLTGNLDLSTFVPDSSPTGPSGLVLREKVRIQGPGANLLTIRRNSPDNFRLLVVATGATVGLRGLTLANGSTSNTEDGGAINNFGTLTIDSSTISGNTAAGFAGAIFSTGTVSVSNSTFSGNSGATGAGALFNFGSATIAASTFSGNSTPGSGGALFNAATMTVTNCTISGNTSTGTSNMDSGGGAIDNFGNAPMLTLNYCTVTNNSAPNIADGVRGGLWLERGTARVTNSIVAGNGAQDIFEGGGGDFTSGGYNLIGGVGASTGFLATDRLNVTPAQLRLSPLTNNGGTTQTHAPFVGSIAIDAGAPGLGVDQRSLPRPIGDSTDAGSVEYRQQAPVVASVSPSNISDKVGAQRTFTLTVNDANGAGDIQETWLLINTARGWESGATLIYRPSATNPTNGQLLLRRGDAFLPAITIGEGSSPLAVLDNGAVRIVGSEVSVSLSTDGKGFSINLPLTIRDGLIGTNTLFTYVLDSAGNTDNSALPADGGFVRKGTYTVTPQFGTGTNIAPTLSRLQPGVTNTTLNSAGLAPNAQTFLFSASDADGMGDIESVIFIAGKARNFSNGAVFVYYPRDRRFYLRSDNGNSWLGGTQVGQPTSTGILENSQVRIDLSKIKVVVQSDGKTVVLSVPMQAKTGLLGTNNVWIRVQDRQGATAPDGDNQGYVLKGTWNVTGPRTPISTTAPSSGNS